MPHIVDWPARMKGMAEFMGVSQADLDLVQATAPIILKHATGLTDAVYDHFLKFPQARQFFLTPEGEVDQEQLARRKRSLVRWLRNSVDFKIEEDFPIYLLAISVSHSHPPAHRAHLGSIPSRFMIGTISFAQTALAELLRREMSHDLDLAMRAAAAWNKLLMVELDILLAGYVTELPTPAEEEIHERSSGQDRQK
jgi:hypothetical protein